VVGGMESGIGSYSMYHVGRTPPQKNLVINIRGREQGFFYEI